MPKMKSHSGTAKRVKRTASGRFKRWKANHSHILTKKDRKRKRRLRHSAMVSDADQIRMKRLLPYDG